MTAAPASRLRGWYERTWPAAIVLASMAVGAGIAAMPLIAGPSVRASRAICDDAVQRALTADTLLEFERARFVAEGMNCNVRRRIRELHPLAAGGRGD